MTDTVDEVLPDAPGDGDGDVVGVAHSDGVKLSEGVSDAAEEGVLENDADTDTVDDTDSVTDSVTVVHVDAVALPQ